jgi:hypothetical protein
MTTHTLHLFQCPTCRLQAWAPVDAKLLCLACNEKNTPLGYVALRRVGAETETDVGTGDVLERVADVGATEGQT